MSRSKKQKRNYSPEFKAAAVERAAKGEKVPQIAKTLGTHESSVYAWIAAAKQRQAPAEPTADEEDKAVDEDKQLVPHPTQRRFSEEEKRKIVEQYLAKTKPVTTLAAEHGTTTSSIYAWTSRYRPRDGAVTISALVAKPAPLRAIEELTDLMRGESPQHHRAAGLLAHLAEEVRGIKRTMEMVTSLLSEAERDINQRLIGQEIVREDEAHLLAKLALRHAIKKLGNI